MKRYRTGAPGILFLLLLTALVARAQAPTATLSGRVTDAKTGQPLPFANVYLNNTSRGTLTDEQGRYRLAVPLGNVEVVSSMVGHQASRQTLRVTTNDGRQLNFALNPSVELSTVTVTAKRTKRWERLRDLFTRELLGTRPLARDCRILNLNDVELTETAGRIQAKASKSIVIENRALGYKLYYDLLSFEHADLKAKIAGTARFESLPATSVEETARWKRNRIKAYQGSLRHFLASLVAGQHVKEGFEVYQANVRADPMRKGLALVTDGQRDILKRADVDSMISAGEVPFERKLVSFRPLEVYYKHIYANNSPYVKINYNDGTRTPNVPFAYSAILLPSKTIDFTTDGWITRGFGMDVRGYFGEEGVASLLPQEWTPAQDGYGAETQLLAGKTLPADAPLDSLARPDVATPTAASPAVFVQIDKPFYLTGDNLWLSAYVLDAATRLPVVSEEGGTLAVELLAPSGHMVQRQWLRTQQGRGAGRFRLADTLASGTYRLRAYTVVDPANAEQEPAFERSVAVRNGLESGAVASITQSPAAAGAVAMPKATPGAEKELTDIQFLPEGGRWLAGVPGRLGVKIVQPNGKGRSVQGVILDERNAEVASFITNRLGMGRLSFTPQKGQRYVARVKFSAVESQDRSAGAVALPTPDAEGLALNADTDSTNLSVTVRGAGRWATQPVYVVLATRGQVLFREKWHLRNGEARALMPLATLPGGLARLTLYNASGQPQAERLVFIPEKTAPIQLSVSLGQPQYVPRQIVGLGLRLRDADGSPVAGLWSAAVQDADQLGADTSAADIRAHLLLAGELRGHVEEPSHYLTEGHSEDLDNLLLTQGWRSYAVNTVATSGWAVSGRVVDVKGKPTSGAEILLALEPGITGAGPMEMKTVKTDADGRFLLTGLTATDTMYVRARVLNMMGKLNVLFDRHVTPYAAPALPAPNWLLATDPATAAARDRQATWQAGYRNSAIRELAEVTVKATALTDARKERPADVQRSSLHNVVDGTLVVDENVATFSNVFEMMQGRLPGVRVVPIPTDPIGYGVYVRAGANGAPAQDDRGNLVFSKSRHPLYILDGVYVEPEILLTLNPQEISRIEVMAGVGAAGIYGVRGGTGVIAFYSKKGSDKKDDTFVTSGILTGYATPRQFYVPRYDTPAEADRADQRDVLFWQPLGRSGPDGLGNVAFPLSDTAKRLRVVVQGISAEGQPISASWTLPVR